MSLDSTSGNSGPSSSSDNKENLRLSMDSSQRMNKNNQTTSGYVTRSKKANLIFSVSRVENHLRKGRYAERIGSTASVYLAGVLEYLVAEMVELAGDLTHKSNRKRITPRDIALVIKNDEELAKLCSNVTIPEGGVQPFIHQVLLTTKRGRRKRQVKFSQDSMENLLSNKRKPTYKQSGKNNSGNTDIDSNLSAHLSDTDDSDQQME